MNAGGLGASRAQALEARLRSVGLQVPHAYAILDVAVLEPDPRVDFLDHEPETSAPPFAPGASAPANSASPFGPLGGAPTLQLVKLRNPNGHAGWCGPWSFEAGEGGRFATQDMRWTRARRLELKLGEDDQGVFW